MQCKDASANPYYCIIKNPFTGFTLKTQLKTLKNQVGIPPFFRYFAGEMPITCVNFSRK